MRLILYNGLLNSAKLWQIEVRKRHFKKSSLCHALELGLI